MSFKIIERFLALKLRGFEFYLICLHHIIPPQEAIEISNKWYLIYSKVTNLAVYIFLE